MLIYIIIACIYGLGFVTGLIFIKWMSRHTYGGAIIVHREENRLVYRFDFDDRNVEDLQYKKEILFKIVPEEDSLVRE